MRINSLALKRCCTKFGANNINGRREAIATVIGHSMLALNEKEHCEHCSSFLKKGRFGMTCRHLEFSAASDRHKMNLIFTLPNVMESEMLSILNLKWDSCIAH